MSPLNESVARIRRALRRAHPGIWGDGTASAREVSGLIPRVILTHEDLMWSKSSEDEEGRITLGLFECPQQRIGVLVDDNGESVGLRLSRSEVQDLHRSLVAWLAGTTAMWGP